MIQSKKNKAQKEKASLIPKSGSSPVCFVGKGVIRFFLKLDEGSDQGQEAERSEVVGGHVGGSVE
jgi:hypothetical protein